MDKEDNILNRNVRVKVFENEERNTTQSITEANEWLKIGHMVIAYIVIPGVGEKRTSVIVKFSHTLLGWKFKTMSSDTWYHIVGFEKPVPIKMIKIYLKGELACIANHKTKSITKAYCDFMEAYLEKNKSGDISADVMLKDNEGEFIHIVKIVRIDWKKREFDSENRTIYKL